MTELERATECPFRFFLKRGLASTNELGGVSWRRTLRQFLSRQESRDLSNRIIGESATMSRCEGSLSRGPHLDAGDSRAFWVAEGAPWSRAAQKMSTVQAFGSQGVALCGRVPSCGATSQGPQIRADTTCEGRWP